jgi:hypothetical protein
MPEAVRPFAPGDSLSCGFASPDRMEGLKIPWISHFLAVGYMLVGVSTPTVEPAAAASSGGALGLR